ncbi:ABC transporter ATP-binding protein [cf. Phormidesmis sp. LEGE 11477]|uniref:ABC transporter ATP-binding protein n=1 Tax=cf. Phormidesmis sp. LEGE 11477 TaxID=1828680 RepID=UPI0018821887|nr:ABC transporter ATP-binding protein [cf. Phormidesmis sp. LEGE 11477]MBE9063103.1 ABC transporter ATP-binding protein [cf. Phormidesmis sp. LEGE 11477]
MPSVSHSLSADLRSLPRFALVSEALNKSYGRGKQRFEAVRDVSLKIAPGEVLAFLGPNGAGKTTTIKMIAGLIRPDAGKVEIAGKDPHRNPQALQGVGAVLEGNRNLYWRLTPLENLEYFGVLRQMPRKLAKSRGMDLLKTFGLVERRNVAVQKLSRGMQQKIAIAVALIHQPHLLLLDEPTLGLDVEAGETVKQLVRQVAESGCAILLTTHQLSVAESLSDRVAIIREGRIITEQPTQALIRQFSKDAGYYIEIEGRLDTSRREAIASLGATVGDSYISYYPEAAASDSDKRLASATLYKILSILDPLPIVEIRQERANLTDIFLQLVKQ